MFILSAIEEEIRVKPQDLHKTPVDAVTDAIEQRYLDKVLPDLGLIVTIYDIQSIDGGFIYPTDGAAFFRTKFRVVVFRPFVGEVFMGKLKSCNKNGLRVSIEFFDDIIVPEHALQDPSFFSEAEKLWVWKFEGNDMFMELGEPIAVRVTAVRFNVPPTPLQQQNASEEDKLIGTEVRPFIPMEVLASITEDGLGMAAWWAGEEDQMDEEPAE